MAVRHFISYIHRLFLYIFLSVPDNESATGTQAVHITFVPFGRECGQQVQESGGLVLRAVRALRHPGGYGKLLGCSIVFFENQFTHPIQYRLGVGVVVGVGRLSPRMCLR